MAEKIASGVIVESPAYRDTREQEREDEREAAIDRLKGRRDASRWTVVMGIGMMFGGTFSSSLTVGGALMVLGGFSSALYHGFRLRRLEGDPWEHDPELEAWEEAQLEGRDEQD